MSVITKINQNIGSLTIGGANTPGKLTILNGKFQMLSGTDPNDYDLKIEGDTLSMTNGAIVLDGNTGKINLMGGRIELDGESGTMKVRDESNNLAILIEA